MKHSIEELEKLSKVINAQQKHIENETINKVVSNYNKLYSSFTSFFKLMCDENIIKEDPYKEEYDLNELQPPDETPIPQNDEEYAVTIRLSHYHALLTQIKENSILTMNNLTPTVIEKIKYLLDFINWDRLFDPQPPGTNTQALNNILFLHEKESHKSFAISTLKATAENINIYKKAFKTELETILYYKSEEYKLFIREEILPQIKLPEELKGENIKEAHDYISKKIRELKKPIFIHLIGEVLKEDFTFEGLEIRKEIEKKLNKYNKNDPKKKKVMEKDKPPKEYLQHALLELSKSASQFQMSIDKSKENSTIYRESTYGVMAKILDYIKHNIFLNNRCTVFNVNVVENEGDKPRIKTIELEKFLEMSTTLQKRLHNYKNVNDISFKELMQGDEEYFNKKVHSTISKTKHTYRMFSALDCFYKDELKIPKGIQIELKTINTYIEKAEALYNDYISTTTIT